jgi:hypothetical protein
MIENPERYILRAIKTRYNKTKKSLDLNQVN